MTTEKIDPLGVSSRPKVLALHLELLQYPILGRKIRERMRELIFTRGIIDEDTFEAEARSKAILSQKREGIDDPITEESDATWRERIQFTRDILTEFYFGLNFIHAEFLQIIEEMSVANRSMASEAFASFNPEIAPWKMLFAQARAIEKLGPEERKQVLPFLREIIVVLSKGMMSDQLSFVGIAKKTLSAKDLEWTYLHRIGRGKIGGKASGMVLARAILHTPEPDDPVDFREVVSIPESAFLGSDVHYEFLDANKLSQMVNYKYLDLDPLTERYPQLFEKIVNGRLPRVYRSQLREMLQRFGPVPLIVRSSSLLEDNFGFAFAGKYDSYFCPNQGSLEQRLENLTTAIKKIYASILSPDAIAYRQQKELIDYDERMGILIQKVEGQRHGDYFFPVVAGVGFSHAPLKWHPRIDRTKGFLRVVAGMGTRAVDRLDNDYAKMIALSHPTLLPFKNTREAIQYSQKNMDVIDIKKNIMTTLPISEVLDQSFPYLQHIASIEKDGDIHPILMLGPGTVQGNLLVGFSGLLKNRNFTTVMKGILKKLQKRYRSPVDIEFTVDFDRKAPKGFRIKLLQCRQQSQLIEREVALPENIPQQDILFESDRMVANGYIENISHVVYIDPEKYQQLNDSGVKKKLAKAVGKLNSVLSEHQYILVGPGRWGSSNIDLGVPVSYADIYNAKLMLEIALPIGDHPPEASYGTHFFLDLVESGTYPLPVYPSEPGAMFHFEFFRQSSNALERFAPKYAALKDYLRVIDVRQASRGRCLEVVMNSAEHRAVGYLAK